MSRGGSKAEIEGKNDKVERWKGGKVERWKGGKVEKWISGKVEKWKGGRVEGWKGETRIEHRGYSLIRWQNSICVISGICVPILSPSNYAIITHSIRIRRVIIAQLQSIMYWD
jgi:hypothetical protein